MDVCVCASVCVHTLIVVVLFAVVAVTLCASWLNGNVNCLVIACTCNVNQRDMIAIDVIDFRWRCRLNNIYIVDQYQQSS